ncbi:hypothetical protein M0M57_06790 [Flavobacterium azooxidireducens]|uniref:Beta-carotene 15,15'-monooxygenase n=1 Tax=Flavobacterium azooxidireducens TaxID=1871076 RepID=A0ABY4KI83_9FLAO|nr:hypothetical protein [Flavobacterium azooxidireducens]UPQ80541.1 hypothetical protein M0M57_06790 [Flavobacterium azooxidireducens]
MIASVFSKSRPFNYILVTTLLVLCFFIYQIQLVETPTESSFLLGGLVSKGIILVLLVASLFITNFITKRNGLSKDNSFSVLFFVSFLLFIPSAFDNFKIILSSFFILLAMRRLISMKSLLTPKEKIFDASLWIFIAALFHFWSILFIFIVFVSIIFHVSGDYRNWVLPFIAFFTVGILFIFFSLLIDKEWLDIVWNQTGTDFKFYYLEKSASNAALVLYALFAIVFLISMIFTMSKRPIIMLASYKKVIFIFLISVLIYIISPEKSNSLLLFGLMPISVLATGFVEMNKDTVLKEIITASVLACGILLFIFQL